MFVYEKKLQFPVKIKNVNPRLAGIILTQYGGPDPNRLHFTLQKPENVKKRGLLLQWSPFF